MINKQRQKGAQIVEFALVSLFFFAVIFMVLEFGRVLFVWNALTEATRRGARMAQVCPVGSTIPQKVAIFDVVNGSLGTSTVVPGLDKTNVSVSYLNDSSAVTTDLTLIKFVQVSITNPYSATLNNSFTLHIPIWGRVLTAPSFTTTLSAESLGAIPTIPPAVAPSPTTACDF